MISSAWAAEQAGSGLPQFQTEHFSSQLFWAILSFAILFLLLRRFVFPTVNRLLDERADHIRQEIESATRMRQEVEQAVAEHGRLLEEIQQDAHRVMEDARRESLRYRDEAVASIREEHRRSKEELFAEVEHAKRRALDDIRAVAVELTMSATEKVVSGHVDRAEAEKAVDELIRELRK